MPSLSRQSLDLCLTAVLTVALGMFACSASVAEAQQASEPRTFNLRPQWQEGQTSRYELWSRRTRQMTMSAGDRQRETSSTVEVTGEVTWRVDRVKSTGGATCTMKYDWLKLSITNAQGDTQVADSRRASGDIEALHAFLQAMTADDVRVTVAPDGSIADVAGIDAIQQQIEVEQMRPEDLDFIESARELAVLAGAPASVTIGDTWQTEAKGTHEMGYLYSENDWQLAQVERIAGIPVATTTSTGELELEVDRSDMPRNGPNIDVTLRDGSVRSQVMFDLQRHEAVGRNTVQNTVIEVNVSVRQRSMSQRIEETVQAQVLRIAEGR